MAEAAGVHGQYHLVAECETMAGNAIGERDAAGAIRAADLDQPRRSRCDGERHQRVQRNLTLGATGPVRMLNTSHTSDVVTSSQAHPPRQASSVVTTARGRPQRQRSFRGPQAGDFRRAPKPEASGGLYPDS